MNRDIPMNATRENADTLQSIEAKTGHDDNEYIGPGSDASKSIALAQSKRIKIRTKGQENGK
jgi:hypothetical protein